MKGRGFRIIEHTADVGVEGYGRDLQELFANAARGLFQIITDLNSVRETEAHDVAATAMDREALLVAWLNEFVYRFDADNLLFRRFDIHELSDVAIQARAYGERVDPARHTMKTAVKSTTYHGLSITEDAEGYTARVIFDI